ncbi:MAG: hypothetical protein IKF68_04565 [Erysipelotrichaceae bacterium]|nr:hypothetical protein [Erysipelotrichaceae bacterium]
MNVDIKKLESIRKELESLDEDDVLFIEDDGKADYVLMRTEYYDYIDEILKQAQGIMSPKVKVISAEDLELTYDEYEAVKKQLNDIIEQTFKPKPEKLN